MASVSQTQHKISPSENARKNFFFVPLFFQAWFQPLLSLFLSIFIASLSLEPIQFSFFFLPSFCNDLASLPRQPRNQSWLRLLLHMYAIGWLDSWLPCREQISPTKVYTVFSIFHPSHRQKIVCHIWRRFSFEELLKENVLFFTTLKVCVHFPHEENYDQWSQQVFLPTFDDCNDQMSFV